MLDVVSPGFSKRCRCYVLYMNGTHVRCECKVRQHYLCKKMQIPWRFFQRINIFCVLLIVVSFVLYNNILLQHVVNAFRRPRNLLLLLPIKCRTRWSIIALRLVLGVTTSACIYSAGEIKTG